MKRELLKAEDGTTFHGGVTEVGPGEFRAHCYAQLNSGSHVDIEQPDSEMFDSREASIAWIESTAKARGFSRYRLEQPK